jgi:hypothetical protein
MSGLITEATTRNPANDSLYRGTRDEGLSAVAPYLFRFTPGQTFANWYLKQGWGKSWGVLMKSGRSLEDLGKHFRNFLLVKTETGQNLYFRFYDPRVIRVFLPTCDTTQLREFFGPVDYFLVEDEDPAFVLRFWHENGVLRTQRLGVADIISSTPDVAPLPDPTEEEILAASVAVSNASAQQQQATAKAEPKLTAPAPEPAQAFRPQPASPEPVQRQPQPAFQPGKPEPAAPKPDSSSPQKKKWNLFD